MSKYDTQRARRTPPQLPLSLVRSIAGLTIDQVIERINEEDPTLSPTRGAISAIENGHRGASARMLTALCAAYGLPDGAFVVDYTPSTREQVPA